MPDGPFPPSSPEEYERLLADLDDLAEFVTQLRGLLDEVVEDGRHIPDRHLESVREAWPHASDDLRYLHASVANYRREIHLSRSESQTEIDIDWNWAERLQAEGLTDAPLRMKLKAFRSRLFAFGRRMTRPWLRSTLRWADSILGSIIDALTLGAAGKEFKEAIENFLEDAEADEAPRVRRKKRRR